MRYTKIKGILRTTHEIEGQIKNTTHRRLECLESLTKLQKKKAFYKLNVGCTWEAEVFKSDCGNARMDHVVRLVHY